MSAVRPPAVAGSFYPADPTLLQQTLDRFLAEAGAPAPDAAVPKALVVPHAGYVYSGAMAARAYAQLAPARERIRRVVLLGPTHRVAVRGLALPGVAGLATPLGELPVDADAVRRVAQLPHVVESAAAHRQEHALEVQLPFLQRVLADFSVLPLAVGDATAEEVAAVLEAVWGGDETLIVISSDLSHFLPDGLARAVDGETRHEIQALRPHLDHAQACGATPLNGLLIAARRHHLHAVELGACNSSDTGGDAERVVGYAAFAFFEDDGQPARLSDAQGETLLNLARGEIASRLGEPATRGREAGWLCAAGASFVTLTAHGELRGCVGTLEAARPLGVDVRENAVAAAFNDPRFPPLRATEFGDLRIGVSVLSAATPLAVPDEAAARAALRPHVDGVILEYRHLRSTFLPQVWEQLPEPDEFLAYLKRKAGLRADFWSDEVRLSRYTVAKWEEEAPDVA